MLKGFGGAFVKKVQNGVIHFLGGATDQVGLGGRTPIEYWHGCQDLPKHAPSKDLHEANSVIEGGCALPPTPKRADSEPPTTCMQA